MKKKFLFTLLRKEYKMDFATYQVESREFANYPNVGNNYVYPTIGLSGETGEVSEKIKKIIRDKNGFYSDDDIEAITKELGDVLWYLGAIASEFQIDLDTIATQNIEKLRSRKERGVLHGSGDNR